MAGVSSVPVFVVAVGATRWPRALVQAITEFEFKEQDKHTATAELTVVPVTREQRAICAGVKKGQPVTLRWGYLGQLSAKIEMKVHSNKPQYGAGVVYKIQARDHGSGLGFGGGKRVYYNTPLGNIVQELAQEEGLSATLPRDVRGTTIAPGLGVANTHVDMVIASPVPPSPVEVKLLREVTTLSQAGRSPRAVLDWIAHRVGCDVHVVGKEVHFLPKPYAAQPQHLLRVRSSRDVILSFGVEKGEGGKTSAPARATTASGMDPLTKKALAFTANDDTRHGRPVLGTVQRLALDQVKADIATNAQGLGDNFKRVRDGQLERSLTTIRQQIADFEKETDSDKRSVHLSTPSGKATDAERNAKAVHGEAEGGAIKAKMTLLGIPTLRKRQIVEVRGDLDVADQGKYLVIGCTHKFAVGYTVELELKRHNEHGKGKKTHGKVNESKPGEPGKVPIRAKLVDSKHGGLIVGETTL